MGELVPIMWREPMNAVVTAQDLEAIAADRHAGGSDP